VSTTRTSPKTLILGGGLSGLLAAWHLHSRGGEVEVWEASSTVGGWAQTLPWPGPAGEPGFLERGPQALRVARGGALDHLLHELEIQLLAPRPRGPRWLGKGGQRHPSPATLAGLLHAPGLRRGDQWRMLAEPFLSASSEDETLHAFFARRLGEGFARECLPALMAGVLAAPAERISVDALPRLRRLEARGGLLLGALRLGQEHTRLPKGGTGALAQALATRLSAVRTSHSARTLEALPDGRWRIHSDQGVAEAAAVVLALPSGAAAGLLKSVAPAAASILDAIPRLDLRVWHSRHRMVAGWERGFGLLIHPPEGRGLLGVVSFASDDPRGVPGLLQLRTYVGGAYPVDPELGAWPGVFNELRRWLPELGEAVQVREEHSPGAFPLLEPGHRARTAKVINALPPGLHWIGADRFGPGVADLAEGVEGWVQRFLPRE
jgi:oxygen-dependent protoporphyrinogen oxidase